VTPSRVKVLKSPKELNSALTVMVGVAQCPRFVRVKVCVAPYSRPWEVGVGQEAAFAVKRRAVAVETRSEDDGDVHVLLGALQLAVGHRLEAQRRHILPDVEGPANGVVGLFRAHFGRHVLYAVGETRCGMRKGRGGRRRSSSTFHTTRSSCQAEQIQCKLV